MLCIVQKEREPRETVEYYNAIDFSNDNDKAIKKHRFRVNPALYINGLEHPP